MLSPHRSRRSLSIEAARALGAIVIFATLAIVAIGYLKPNPFAHHEKVRAIFSDASGIGVVGAEVRMAGTPVGRITGRERVGSRALLTLTLDRDVGTIHADATAELRPHLAFEGTAYVDLHPGSPSARTLGGDAIPVSQTRVYVPLDQALRVFRPRTRTALRESAQSVGKVLEGTGRAGLRRTLRGAPELTRTLAPAARAASGAHGTELAGAVAGLSHTFTALARERAQMVPLLRSAQRSFAAFDADSGAPLAATLAELPGVLGSLDRGGKALERIVARLDPLAVDLDPGLRSLAPTLAAALPLVRDARPALEAATPFVADVRAALAGGAGSTPPARRLMRTLTPTVNQLESSLLPALHAKTARLHIPAYLSFVNLFGGGGGASRPFQTGKETTSLGAGHYMRFGLRFLTGVGFPLPPCTLLAKASPTLAQQLSDAGECTP